MTRAIGHVLGLRAFLPFGPPWTNQTFAHHRFDNPGYDARTFGRACVLPNNRARGGSGRTWRGDPPQ